MAVLVVGAAVAWRIAGLVHHLQLLVVLLVGVGIHVVHAPILNV